MPITYDNAQSLKSDNAQPLKVHVKVNVKVHDSFADVGDPIRDYFFQSRKVSAEFRRSVEAACPRAFTTGRDASFCVCLLQYLMFPSSESVKPGTSKYHTSGAWRTTRT